MRLVDANIPVYAFTTSFPQQERARAWLDGKLNDGVPIGLPWPSLLAFVRLTSNRRLFDRPVSVATAWRQVEDWLACESAWVPQPTPRHQGILGELLIATGVRAEHVPDAHLAAYGPQGSRLVVIDSLDDEQYEAHDEDLNGWG